MALGLIWLALGGAILYAFAWWGGVVDMQVFCLAWLSACPVVTGFYCGWRSGERGFAAAAKGLLLLSMVLGAAWWWLFPGLWDALLWLKATLYALAVGALLGGLAVGLKQARPLPPEPPVDDESDDADGE